MNNSDQLGINAVPTRFYPIGTPGQAWAEADKALWRARQVRQRSYFDEVQSVIEDLRTRFEVVQYGQLDYGPDERYPLFAIRNRDPSEDLPYALVTGGVHGYETSGVHGALGFVEQHLADYAGRLNCLVVPCISPWAYERIHRWNAHAVDPNRSFDAVGKAAEATAVLELIRPLLGQFIVHIDLHETTDTDESEFRPALAARDGKSTQPGVIPDGFYLVDDSANPQPQFQQAVIAAVAQVTHIAAADANGEIIGSAVVAEGVIEYPFKALGLCAGISGARYTTTTEVYPDSTRATPAQCNAAQIAAVRAALDFALAHAAQLPS
jgi:hypothetical protein